MTHLAQCLAWLKSHKALTLCFALALAWGGGKAAELLTPAKEIALIIGEPWKDMQARSSAKIADDIPDEIWYRMPQELAYLRFADPQYGFVTPPAKFFSVGFNRGKIDTIRMSPQVEPLPLDEALKVVLDLQDQWRKGGWVLTTDEEPAYEDNETWRAAIRACKAGSTFWHAADLYQVLIDIYCFKDERYPNEERFLVTLAIAKPWIKPWEHNFPLR